MARLARCPTSVLPRRDEISYIAALASSLGGCQRRRRTQAVTRWPRALLQPRGELSALKAKEKKLLDAYLDGTVPSEVYRERA